MFNLFKGGIKNKYAKEIIPSLDWLIMHIQQNLNAESIKALHQLYLVDKKAAKEKKLGFDYLTPHGTFYGKREAEKIKEFSGILYFDIDSCGIDGEVQSYKDFIVSQYKKAITLCGTSISGQGVFFYVKIGNKDVLNKCNFNALHHYFRTVVFKGLPIDGNALGIERAQFLPYDSNLYVNKEASIELSEEDIIEAIEIYNEYLEKKKKGKKEKRKKQSINSERYKEVYRDRKYRLDFSFSNRAYLDISEILKTVNFKTVVPVEHPIVDIKPVPVVSYFPRNIKEGKKHKSFYAGANILMYNNPDIDLHTLLSYFNYLNKHRTIGEGLTDERLKDVITFAYYHAKETGELLVSPEIVNIHFNPNCGLSKEEKKKAANYLNGLLKEKENLEKLLLVAEAYEAEGIEVNRKNLVHGLGLTSAITGKCHMSAPTVRKYFKKTSRISDLKHQKRLIEEAISTYIQSLSAPLNQSL